MNESKVVPTAASQAARIFLSYARDDDEAFVRRLYEDLTAHGFDVWWDRVWMPGRGLTFLHEIRDAINSRDRLLLVLGPKAVQSAYVVAEWQHAVSFGKAINPILRIGDYSLVPHELKLLHVEDFRDETRYDSHLQNLVRQLAEPIAPLGKLIGVPGLPSHLLTRSDRLEVLKHAVLADLQRPVVVGAAAAVCGLHGMGGIGKSVLANLLARDHDIRRAFPDGIVWIPLGREPNLLALLVSVAGMFGPAEAATDIDQARAQLAERLAGQAVLLVLDDAWTPSQLSAFDILGPRCRAVVTTRDAGLIVSRGWTQHQVQFPTEAESLSLLAVALDRPVGDLPGEAVQVIAACGRLPLAVALCAGLVRRGVSWTGVLDRLESAALDAIADRTAQNEQHRSIWAAMRVSVDALAADERQRFIELGVFAPGMRVPEAAVRTMWAYTGGLDEFAAEDLLISLRERSLLRLDATAPAPGLASQRRVIVHDLLHDFAVRAAGDQKALHVNLLAAYRQRCTAGWATGPDDGYFMEEIVHHALQTGEATTADELVRDGFLQRKAEVAGEVATLPDARVLAEQFAALDRRDELLRCATIHAQLADRLRASPDSLVILAHRGDPVQVRQLIELEPDESRRGLLNLAAAALLTDAGHHEAAEPFRAVGTSVVTAHLGNPVEGHRHYTFAQKHLAQSLLDARAVDSSMVPLPELPLRNDEAGPAHGQVPLFAYLVAMCALPNNLIPPALIYWLLMSAIAGPQPWYVAVVLVGGAFGMWIAAMVLLARRPALVENALRSMARGFTQFPKKRQKILHRILRFTAYLRITIAHEFLSEPIATPQWTAMFVATFREDQRSQTVADLIRRAIAAGPRCCDGLIPAFQSLPESVLREALELVAARVWLLHNRWEMLRILIACRWVKVAPAALLALLRTSIEDSKFGRETHHEILEELGRLPSPLLATSLATAVWQEQPRSFLADLSSSFMELFGSKWLVPELGLVRLRIPLNPLEPVCYFAAVLPSTGFFALMFLVCSVPAVCGAYLWFVMSARSYRPQRELALPRADDFEPILETLRHWSLSWRALRQTILARLILRLAPERQQPFAEFSRDELRSVFSKLAHAGLLSNRSDLILNTMHDSRLLSATMDLPDRWHEARRLIPADDARQIRRTLPLEPPGLYAALLIVFAAIGTWLWHGVQEWTWPDQPLHWPALAGVALALFGVAAVQVGRPFRLMGYPRGKPWLWNGLFWIAMSVIAALLIMIFQGNGFRRGPFVVVIWALGFINLLAPTVIDRWRGAGLLYPSTGQVWIARLVWMPLLAAIAILLTILAQIVIST